VIAIFVLVVLAALGATLVTIFSGQQRGHAFDALGMQAYQAARAGIEFGSYHAITADNCIAHPVFALPASLAGFSVRVNCTRTTHTEAGDTVRMYEITATACNRTPAAGCPNDADATYVERQLRVVVRNVTP
jgi:MSHA biogenesis protein MshP